MAETTEKVANDVASELFDQSRRPSDPEVKALGLKSKTRYNYFQQWKKLNEATPGAPEGKEGSP